MRVAIEAKATAKVTADHLRGLRSLVEDHSRVKRRVVVCLEPKSRITEDRIAEVTGKAGSEPLYPDNPYASANRRISIVLLREAPVLPPAN